jgi:hypothetical protein
MKYLVRASDPSHQFYYRKNGWTSDLAQADFFEERKEAQAVINQTRPDRDSYITQILTEDEIVVEEVMES